MNEMQQHISHLQQNQLTDISDLIDIDGQIDIWID